MNSDPIAVTVAKAAALTGLSAWTIYQLVNAEELKATRLGKRILVDYDSLKSYVKGLPGVAS